jgi:hypothetical protein
MIRESWPWRDRLAKDADLIDRWTAKTADSERRSFLIEQKVFFAAYERPGLPGGDLVENGIRHRTDEVGRATAIEAAPPPETFRSGRDFAASLRTQTMAVETPTPNLSAACRTDSPPSAAATTRSRKS